MVVEVYWEIFKSDWLTTCVFSFFAMLPGNWPIWHFWCLRYINYSLCISGYMFNQSTFKELGVSCLTLVFMPWTQRRTVLIWDKLTWFYLIYRLVCCSMKVNFVIEQVSVLWTILWPRPTTLLKKKLWHRYFPVNFAKFRRTTFLKNTPGRLLLNLATTCLFKSPSNIVFTMLYCKPKLDMLFQMIIVNNHPNVYIISVCYHIGIFC